MSSLLASGLTTRDWHKRRCTVRLAFRSGIRPCVDCRRHSHCRSPIGAPLILVVAMATASSFLATANGRRASMAFRILQKFLLTDLDISNAKVRSRLTWAAASPSLGGSIPFSPEDAARIASMLERIERSASNLTDALYGKEWIPSAFPERSAISPAGLPLATTSLRDGNLELTKIGEIITAGPIN